MTPNKISVENLPWKQILLAFIPIAAFALLYFIFPVSKPAEENLGLSPEVKQAYAEALQLAAVGGSSTEAIQRLDTELAKLPVSGQDANNLYTKAKVDIYKADIMLTYGLQFENGFTLLGEVYSNALNSNSTRGEALMLAMAHSVQGLDEGLLTMPQVRDYVLLNKNFAGAVNIEPEDAAALETAEDTYVYLARGFTAAMGLTSSEKIYALEKSYSVRLLAPFVVPPPTGGYYHNFVASLEGVESTLDTLVVEDISQGAPYQESAPTSYYNLARAYEALPKGDSDVVGSMARLHEKLAAYVSVYPNSAFGTAAYLTGISTRLVCKAVDLAGFDVSRVNKAQLQPYLDEIYSSEGWVVPCREAFEVVAKDIDPRFAKYF